MTHSNPHRQLLAALKMVEKFVPYHPPWKDPFASELQRDYGVEWIEFLSSGDPEPCKLTGWATRPKNPRGTVILIHGFRENSYSEWIVSPALRLIRNLNVAIIAPDLRCHGNSSQMPPSFGLAESWDISGAIAWAKQNDYPGPYLLHGASLGAMAACICAARDANVKGAFLKSPPASPRYAVANAIQLNGLTIPAPILSLFVGSKLKRVYGRDMMYEGDVLNHPSAPAHRPAIFYAVGDREEYGYKPIQERFRHWYAGEDAVLDVPPHEAPSQRKWFKTVWGGRHAFGLNEYPEMESDVDNFFGMLLKS